MEKRTESRLSRFSRLLRGSTRARRHHAFMIALVLVALLSLAGVVSADDYWPGNAPETKLNGTVNGGVDAKFNNTWKTDNPIDNDNTTAEFTGLQTSNIKFARLYVVPYTGNMTEEWNGTLTVTLVRTGYSDVPLVTRQPLDLTYDGRGIGGTVCNSSIAVPPYTSTVNGLCRVTSDYVAILNVTDYMTSSTLKFYLNTTNVSGRFDGRIKEAKLVYGWDVTSGSTGCTKYWINEGQDPITKNIGTYTNNKTTFGGVGYSTNYTANLWVDFVAGNSTSGPGYGKYWWNGRNFTAASTWNSGYPPADWTGGTYAGISHWTWNDMSGVTTNKGNNVLEYSRTNDYYKIIFALLTVKNTGNLYDFSGRYAGTPVGYKQEVYSNPPTTVSEPEWDVTNSNLAYNDDVYETGVATDMTYYGGQRFNFTITEDRTKVVKLTATWIGKGYNSDGDGATLYIWNWNNNSYDQLATTSSANKVTLTGSKDTSLTNYISSSDNKVILAAVQNTEASMSANSHLDTDYVNLVVVDP